jgi:ankyrin repeat protein
MRLHKTFRSAALVAGFAALACAQETGERHGERYYQAIRTNNATQLQELVKSANTNEKDKRGTTPLHYAAAYGSVESVRVLLAAGADVNARNDFEATPLMWSVTEPEKVRMLVAKGADVNAKSKMGRTPIWLAASNDGSSATVKYLLEQGAKLDGTEIVAATAANDMATIRLLLEKRQDVNARDAQGLTPLINAALNGNTRLADMLLARGAQVNAASSPEWGGKVKNGNIAIGSFTALLVASTYGPVDLVKLLLDAGADVNVQEIRKMTPLMFAVTTDHADPRIVRLLLGRGADTKIKDGVGLTAADWAKKMNNPAILRELGLHRDNADQPKVIIPTSLLGTADPRPAVAKSVDLLQRASGSFFQASGCGACHAQNLTAIAVNAAAASRIPVNEKARAMETKGAQLGFAGFEQPLLQRGDPPVSDIISLTLVQLATENAPADRTTDAMVHNLMAQQRQAGNWHFGGIARPPAGDGDNSRTASAIRALAAYAPAGRKAEARRRIERAATWLASAPVKTTEDLDMQLLGLKWAGLPQRAWLPGMRSLASQQREDGGWGQTPDLASDAYATGQALFTLHELGVPPSDLAFKRGVQYLIRNQQPDGSWHVVSRTAKIQPYFDTIFPYGHDQWISNAATSWATAALSYASANQQMAKR